MPFPALDKSYYADLSNFIRGKEISFVGSVGITYRHRTTRGCSLKKQAFFIEETRIRTKKKFIAGCQSAFVVLLALHINMSSGPYLFS